MSVPGWPSRGFAIVSVTLAIGLLGLAAFLETRIAQLEQRPELVVIIAILLVFASYPIVGSLLIARQPTNRVGWLFSVIGLGMGLNMAGDSYAYYDHLAGTGLPGAVAGAWVASWIWILTIPVGLCFTLMLFPDGRLPSPRWRPTVWLGIGIAAIWALSAALAPGTIYDFGFENPLGLEIIAGLLGTAHSASLFAFLLLVAPASAVAVGVRLRRAHGIERQQMKWFMFVAAIAIGALTVAGVLAAVFGDTQPGEGWLFGMAFVAWVTALAAFSALPVAVAFAVLRYRLYDIDLIIRRTLVYGFVTITLAGVYVAGVLGLQAALRPFTEGSALAVATSTLAVAALFRPLRGRIQRAVDRRFYRSRYDAVRTLESFSTRLRSELDLDSLSGELQLIASATMQPASTSIWLRDHGGQR